MRDNHNYIATFTGKKFFPLDPRAEEIDVRDIAHALSMQCRFGGHAKRFYSVAQHSLFVSLMVPPVDKLWALLHDAAEAYLVDLPRPIKHDHSMKAYREAEAKVMAAVCEAFGLSPEQPASVTEADHRMVMTEARELMNWGSDVFADWTVLGEPYPNMDCPTLAPSFAEVAFLKAFDDYQGRRLIAA